MTLPRLLLTGASGFLGRHLLELLRDEYRVVALARRSQARCGATPHPNVVWRQVDIGERAALARCFAEIRAGGRVDAVVHLAAYYDFDGDEVAEYERTNVFGLRNVLEECRGLGVRRFVFSSSTAACAFPREGAVLDEDSPADGEHVYARTKRAGEEMLRGFEAEFPVAIVRFAALFSDWCEYAPLYGFLSTWLSGIWNARVLAGRGASAIPYLHVDDATMFLAQLLDRADELPRRVVLLASPDGCTSHLQLFRTATKLVRGRAAEAFHLPKPFVRPGLAVRDLLGRFLGERPFERSWMADYVDLRMTVDARKTRALLGWEARPRLEILRRLPFLLENRKTDPLEWHRRNREAMKHVTLAANLRIHWLLEKHEPEISARFTEELLGPKGRERFPSYQGISPDDMDWNHRLILRNLMHSVRTGEKGIFTAYCRDLAERRFQQGYRASELVEALEALAVVCFRVLRRDPETGFLREDLVDHVTMTIRSGQDAALDVFERDAAARRHLARVAEAERAERRRG